MTGWTTRGEPVMPARTGSRRSGMSPTWHRNASKYSPGMSLTTVMMALNSP